jgi:hypothetical protein
VRRLRLPPCAACAALLLLAASRSPALDWPVAHRIVTGTFGESRGDHFHTGIDIGGGEQDVHPILGGEVVFRYEEGTGYTSLPRGVGSFIVLQHPDNILSVYCHLKRGTVAATRTVASSDRLGIEGDTGASEGTHLHIAVYDRETSVFLNPLSLLPPLKDTQAPVVRRISLRLGDREVPVENGLTLPSGQGEVLGEVFDPREDVRFLWPMAPYALRLSLNGKEVSKVVFDSFQVRDGRTVVGGTKLAVEDLYASPTQMRCGAVELRGGESHLMLAVRDFAGNETVREAFFTIRE